MAYNTYRKTQAATATPGDLVVMLYDGVLRFCDMAAESLDRKDPAGAGYATNRALAIVDYLQCILDPHPAPELVRTLDSLYAFWTREIARANALGDAGPIRAVRGHIRELRDAWDEAKTTVARDDLTERLR